MLEAVQANIGALHFLEERLAFLGRDQAHAGALEQGQPGAQFELADQSADIGLRGVQRLGRRRHRTQSHDAAERLDLPQIHPYLPYRI